MQTALFWKLSIYEDDRDSFNACLIALFDISGNQFFDGWVLHRLVKPLHIELELRSNFLNLGIVQGPVVLKELVMKLPEFPLSMRRQGRNSGLMSDWVYGREGKILMDQLDLFGIFLQQLLEQRFESRTARSLIVTENSNGNRSFLRTLKWKTGGIKLIHFFELNNLYHIA